MKFKDYYSIQSDEYSKYRPTYPGELFQYLNSVVSNHNLAVDCATGNGQAALGLSEYFKKVIAIDASRSQIKNAFHAPNIDYKVAKAEETGLEPESVDLVTVATAIHWIDADSFYAEAKRILKPDGVIAAWTYGTTNEISPKIDEVINSFTKNVLEKHWDDGIKKVWTFEELNFPFKQLASPDFEIKKQWTYEDYLNYIYTWSSVHAYIEIHNQNPIELLKDELKKVWGEEKREIKWKIKMKAGRVY